MFNKQKVLEKAKARVAKLETELASKPLAGDELKSAISSRITDAKDRLKTNPEYNDPHLQKLAASNVFSSGPNREAVTMASHKAMSQAKPEITEDTSSTTSWKGAGNYEYKLDKASGDIFITKAPGGGYTGKVREADPLTSIKAELATLKPTPAPKADTSADTSADTKADTKPPELSREAKNRRTAALTAAVAAAVADFIASYGEPTEMTYAEPIPSAIRRGTI